MRSYLKCLVYMHVPMDCLRMRYCLLVGLLGCQCGFWHVVLWQFDSVTKGVLTGLQPCNQSINNWCCKQLNIYLNRWNHFSCGISTWATVCILIHEILFAANDIIVSYSCWVPLKQWFSLNCIQLYCDLMWHRHRHKWRFWSLSGV